MSSAIELPPRQNAYDYDDLIASGHGELFGPTNGRLPKPKQQYRSYVIRKKRKGGRRIDAPIDHLQARAVTALALELLPDAPDRAYIQLYRENLNTGDGR